MIRKETDAIAEALGLERKKTLVRYQVRLGFDMAAKAVSNILAVDNLGFDRERFLAIVRGERESTARPCRTSATQPHNVTCDRHKS